jgi:hypothetical protein
MHLDGGDRLGDDRRRRRAVENEARNDPAIDGRHDRGPTVEDAILADEEQLPRRSDDRRR